MTTIRRLSLGHGIDSFTAFHAFTVNEDGDLRYTFADSGDQKIQTSDQLDQYAMYEAGTADYRYEINDDGELVITYTTP